MARSIKDLKKSSKANFERHLKEMENLKKGGFQKDERLWKPTLDKSDNALAIIRWLPLNPEEEELMNSPWSMLFKHSFKGPGGWYIENCLTTLGRGTPDPACEENSKLWDTKIKANEDIVRKRKRAQVFTSNIYVIQDKLNPETEGKVWLFNYGPKIWGKLNRAMHPEDGDPTPAFDPFDFWEGADFVLKVKMQGKKGTPDYYHNYDDSKFLSPAPFLKGNEKALDEIWNKTYKLSEFTLPDKFKSYDELKKKLMRVLGDSALNVSDIKTPRDENPLNPDWERATDVADDDASSFFQKLNEKEDDNEDIPF